MAVAPYLQASLATKFIAGDTAVKNAPVERVWLKSYGPGVPADVDVGRYPNLVAMLDESYRQYADRVAYTFMGKPISYAQIDSLSKAFAAYLQSLGLAKGDRVAVMMPNVPQYPVAVAGILRAGLVLVNVNPLYTPRELEHQLKDAGAKAIVILENFAATLDAVQAQSPIKHVVVAAMGDMLGLVKGAIVNYVVRNKRKMVPAYTLAGHVKFNAAIAAGTSKTLTTPTLKPDDVAVLQYTGGTTGVSKGATLLHRNLVANLLQVEAWVEPALRKLGNDPIRIVAALPLYHIFAFTVCAMMGTRLGMNCLLIANPRDIPGFLKELKTFVPNILPAVNTLYAGLMAHPDFSTVDWSKLVISNGGGMAVQRAVAERWLKATGCPIAEGYGLSETSPVAVSNRPDTPEFTGTIGLPVSNTEVVIRDDDDRDVPMGEPGEICIRGPQVMAGYWQRPDETAKVMTADGFFRTGDVGVMDANGFFRIVDRKKDMVLVSGFNVYPNEVEDVVAKLDGVLECAVVGVPDEKSGEAVKLVVVKKDPNLTEAQVRDFCRANLTGYKQPKVVEFRTEMPKTPVGKILRRELRDKK
jgi:long-chain acyl-CoA synthetase